MVGYLRKSETFSKKPVTLFQQLQKICWEETEIENHLIVEYKGEPFGLTHR